jgi:hypothetical protein
MWFNPFNRQFRLTGLAGFLVSAGLFTSAGCGGGSSSGQSDGSVVARGQYKTLRFTLSTTKSTFAQGEQVPFTFTISNAGTGPVNYTEEAQKYRALIFQNNTPVWDSNYGVASTTASQVTLAPGASRRFEFTWSQKNSKFDNAPEGQVPPGVYSVTTFANMGLYGGNFPEDTRQAMDPEADGKLLAGPINITIR